MINFGKPIVGDPERDAIDRVLSSGVFVHGKYTELFERSFSDLFLYQHAISVANCTAGLHLAHFSLTKHLSPDERAAKEVICSAMTHVATAHAIELAGLKPVFVDCKHLDGNMDPEAVENAITENTVGIAAMHFNGVPCEIETLMKLANKNSLYVVEDCAISLGASVNNKPVGTFGDAGAFSFHPVKQLTTGEGGMIVVNDAKLASDLKLERAFGVDRTFNKRAVPGVYEVPMLGFNYRMAELPAAIGCEQLKRYNDFKNRRQENFVTLKGLLRDDDRLELVGGELITGRSFYSLIVKLKGADYHKRNNVISMLKQKDIQTSVYYPHPIPRLQYYRERHGFKATTFQNATLIADTSIALPIAPHLDGDDMVRISTQLKKVL